MIRKRNLRSRVLNRNSNKRLYETIIKDVAKTIKRHLNESNNIIVYPNPGYITADMVEFDYKNSYTAANVTVYIDLRNTSIDLSQFNSKNYIIPVKFIYYIGDYSEWKLPDFIYDEEFYEELDEYILDDVRIDVCNFIDDLEEESSKRDDILINSKKYGKCRITFYTDDDYNEYFQVWDSNNNCIFEELWDEDELLLSNENFYGSDKEKQKIFTRIVNEL